MGDAGHSLPLQPSAFSSYLYILLNVYRLELGFNLYKAENLSESTALCTELPDGHLFWHSSVLT